MSIAYDNSSSGQNTGTSLTYSHTCGSGSNRYLVVGIANESDNQDTITSVTYGGVPMTRLKNRSGSGLFATFIYGLANPASGANDVVVGSSNSKVLRSTSASYTGVKQTGQPDATGTTIGIGVTTMTMTVTTTVPNAWVVGFGYAASGGATAGANTTIRNGTVHFIADSNGYGAAGSRSLNITHTNGNDDGVQVALVSQPEVISASETVTMTDALTALRHAVVSILNTVTATDTITTTVDPRMWINTPKSDEPTWTNTNKS